MRRQRPHQMRTLGFPFPHIGRATLSAGFGNVRALFFFPVEQLVKGDALCGMMALRHQDWEFRCQAELTHKSALQSVEIHAGNDHKGQVQHCGMMHTDQRSSSTVHRCPPLGA